jgi:hypothetical protein
MRWIKDPQRDSRENIRAAQQALVYAGFPHGDAVTEVAAHLTRVRAALAAPRHALRAGFLVGTAIAVALILTLGLGSFLIVVAVGSGAPSRGPAGWSVVRGTANFEASGGSPLDIILPVVTTVAVLGVAGAGIALVTRGRSSSSRWRGESDRTASCTDAAATVTASPHEIAGRTKSWLAWTLPGAADGGDRPNTAPETFA